MKVLVFLVSGVFSYLLITEVYLVNQDKAAFWAGLGSGIIALVSFISIVLSSRQHRERERKNLERLKGPYSLELKTQSSQVLIGNPFRGIFIVGSAGSGKSESIAVPLLSEYLKKSFSGLIYDFKFPTLANDAQKLLNELKTPLNHFYLDFNNPLRSYRVNPFNPKYLLNVNYAREFAQAIVSNLTPESIEKKDFWTRSATDLLTACIWYLKEEEPEKCTLPHVLAMITSNDTALLETLQKNPQSAQMTISTYNAMQRGSNNQLSGVIGTLQSMVAQINTPELMYVFSGDDFSLDLNNPSSPIVLTVGSYPTLTETFAPLCSLVITVATKLMNQPNKHQSFVLLDESPTVFVPNLDVLPNTGRDNKISTVLMVQDLAQLRQGYGDVKADVLFAACNNHLYGRVSSSKTAEVLSSQFGKQDKVYTTHSSTSSSSGTLSPKGGSESSTTSTNIQEREIIKAAEFLKLQPGEFVVSLVESNKHGFFKDRFNMINRSIPKHEIVLTPPEHPADAIKANYLKIRSEVDEILYLTREERKGVKSKLDEIRNRRES
jgi:type IV secretory pathway TraG/TraD family ATPase VirD4